MKWWLLMVLFAVHVQLAAQDPLLFSAECSTSPGIPLKINLRPIAKYDHSKTNLMFSGRTPEAIDLRLYHCPEVEQLLGECQKEWSHSPDSGITGLNYYSGSLNQFGTMGPIHSDSANEIVNSWGITRKIRDLFQSSSSSRDKWHSTKERILLKMEDMIWHESVDIFGKKSIYVPGQMPGVYVVEIMIGKEWIYFPWEVSHINEITVSNESTSLVLPLKSIDGAPANRKIKRDISTNHHDSENHKNAVKWYYMLHTNRINYRPGDNLSVKIYLFSPFSENNKRPFNPPNDFFVNINDYHILDEKLRFVVSPKSVSSRLIVCSASFVLPGDLKPGKKLLSLLCEELQLEGPTNVIEILGDQTNELESANFDLVFNGLEENEDTRETVISCAIQFQGIHWNNQELLQWFQEQETIWQLYRVLPGDRMPDGSVAVQIEYESWLKFDQHGKGAIRIPKACLDPTKQYRIHVNANSPKGHSKSIFTHFGRKSPGLLLEFQKNFYKPMEKIDFKLQIDEPTMVVSLTVYDAISDAPFFWESSDQLFDTKRGKKILQIDPRKAELRLRGGVYRVAASTMNSTGECLVDERLLIVADEKTTLPSSRMLKVLAEKASVPVGHQVRYLVLLPRKETYLHWFQESRSKISIHGQWFSGNVGIISFQMQPLHFPNGWLHVVTSCEGKTHFAGSIICCDQANNGIKINARIIKYDKKSKKATVDIEAKQSKQFIHVNASLAIVDAWSNKYDNPWNLNISETNSLLWFRSSMCGVLHNRTFIRDGETLDQVNQSLMGSPIFWSNPSQNSRCYSPVDNMKAHKQFHEKTVWIPSLDIKGKRRIEIQLPNDDKSPWSARIIGCTSTGRHGYANLRFP